MQQTLERMAQVGRSWMDSDAPAKFCLVCGQVLVSELVFGGYNIYSGTATVVRVLVCPNSRVTERLLAGRYGWAFASCQRWTDYGVQQAWTNDMAALGPEPLPTDALTNPDDGPVDLSSGFDPTDSCPECGSPFRGPIVHPATLTDCAHPWHTEVAPLVPPPFRRSMLDGSPCWCISDDEPHEGWVHSPTCMLYRKANGHESDAAPGTVPHLCGVPATDQNKYHRTCRLLKGHDGLHACDDSPGTPTGAAGWTWENPGDVAQRVDRQVFFDLRDASIGEP